MALQGVDVSTFQGSMSFSQYDFVIVKSSEGVNYQDDKMEMHAQRALSEGKLLGFYHYARPDLGNTPAAEAQSMIRYINNYLGQCIIVLDWEEKSLNYPASWALGFMQYIAANTPARPILYIQASVENNGSMNTIRDNGFGLWVAHWGVSTPSVKNWANWQLWQYTDTPLDLDRWSGDANDWNTYAGTTATTYEWISANKYLDQKQMQNNTRCLWQYFQPAGWSMQAVAALASNMETESTINPGIWEGLSVGGNPVDHGYGLVQWTPYTKITDWLNANGYSLGSGIGQCDRIQAEKNGVYGQWYNTSAYPISFQEFSVSTSDPGELAYAFMYNYERPGNYNQPWRKTDAVKWFNFLQTVGGWVYVPRLNADGIDGNPYWYSENPFWQAGFGLPNCTCYCWGRWYEIQGVPPELPLGDANTWFPRAVDMGKKTGSTPQLGAIICTYYPIGGHVAIVEVINDDGSIVVSNSGYGSAYFWTETLYPPSYVPSWAPGGAYVQGFIYLDITPISPPPEPPPPPLTKTKIPFILNGNIWLKI